MTRLQAIEAAEQIIGQDSTLSVGTSSVGFIVDAVDFNDNVEVQGEGASWDEAIADFRRDYETKYDAAVRS